jgi:prepilin-type N-terminal cleavage/methylation domain-containing protein
MRTPKLSGFTLIELLIVISIISILLALFLPSVQAAREQARRSVCAGNLRQWYIGVEAYANDSKGYYPGIVGSGQSIFGQDNTYARDFTGNDGKVAMWMWEQQNAVTSYIAKGITRCPSADWGYAQKEWQNLGTSDTPYRSGITDYSIKVGFGSCHNAFDSNGYWKYPSPINGSYDRGLLLEYRYPRKAYGFFLNFRQEQRNIFGTAPQSQQSVMFMDRARSPLANPWDNSIHDFGPNNHKDVNSVGAAGAMVMEKNGRVRWMNLTEVWNRGTYSQNFYDAGYGEGTYAQYVDDEIARLWQ